VIGGTYTLAFRWCRFRRILLDFGCHEVPHMAASRTAALLPNPITPLTHHLHGCPELPSSFFRFAAWCTGGTVCVGSLSSLT